MSETCLISGPNGSIELGNGSLAIICGPCVIESREHALRMSEAIKNICDKLELPLIYKSSFDKANRTSASGYRGLGMEQGLEILSEVRTTFGVPIVTDIHVEEQAEVVAEVADLLQIPAFLCRQTDLLISAGRTKKPVMVKKGQFVHPEDMRFAKEKLEQSGARVLLCERGATFGYRELIVDFRSLEIMRGLGCPVVFDATHSVQIMGGANGKSSGNRKYVPMLARAAVAVGVDAVFIECHNDPDSAPSDGPNMLPLERLEELLTDLKAISELKLATRVC
jgi:2-dehydro-3-deoxyphosphooctonate aldolase (KDO 8-P synthase)